MVFTEDPSPIERAAVRFTLRKSGRLMTTVYLAHHLGALEIVKVLCWFSAGELPYSDSEAGDEWPRLTRRRVEDAVREAVLDNGRSAYFSDDDWTEHYQPREIVRIARWADESMRRLYPGLIDPAYVDYMSPLLAEVD